jgi:hypothetical protein
MTATHDRRPSRLLLVAAAPLAGAAFIVLLPVVGAALLVGAGLGWLWPSAARALRELAATVVPPMRPGQAHLTGSPPDERPGAASPDAAAGDDEPPG